MDFKDYYATLGVPKSASEKDVKQAYRRLARKFHPDVNPGDQSAEARFKEINEAYEVLGDREKRKKYDELGANWRLYEQARQSGAPSGAAGAPFGNQWTWNTGGGGFRPMSEDEVSEIFGEADSPFSDFFRTFFGGGPAGGAGRRRRTGRAGTRPGRDVEQAIELELEDVLNGSIQRLGIQHDGEMRTVEVRIPAGVTEGSRVRVSGEGERGTGHAKSGDLYLRVRLRAHPRFERRGRDLYVRVKLPVTTAVLGGEVEVPTLGGRSLRLKIPAATQNGQTFRLRGQGLPEVGKPDSRGDLYATIEVKLPATLSPEARQHYEALRDIEHKAPQG